MSDIKTMGNPAYYLSKEETRKWEDDEGARKAHRAAALELSKERDTTVDIFSFDDVMLDAVRWEAAR